MKLDDLPEPGMNIEVALRGCNALKGLRKMLLGGTSEVKINKKWIHPVKGVISHPSGDIPMVRPERTSPLRLVDEPKLVMVRVGSDLQFIRLKFLKKEEDV